MKEQTGPYRDEELRAKTLDNNLTWLESFGCQVNREGEIIHVSNKELPEYDAQIVVGLSNANMTQFESLLADFALTGSYIYLDDRFSSDLVRAALSSNGFKPVLVSQVKATRLTRRHANTNVELKLAKSGDHTQWSDLYSRGFTRAGAAAEMDRTRWKMSFKHPNVLHWFFMHDGSRLGVCQTCICNDVVGIYSFTLLPAYRRLAILVCAARAVRAEMLRRGETVIYFERVRTPTPLLPAAGTSSTGFKVVRKFVGYKKSQTLIRARE